ncbi:hypothetical protein K505DRAFT_336212, partial [Melanomma pulvis-pyrius CBS 109.77]
MPVSLPGRTLLLVFAYILSFLSPLASATNAVHLVNHCPYDMYFWVVGPNEQIHDNAYSTVPGNGGTVIHSMRAISPESPGGINIKIRDLPHYEVAPAGIIQVEYALDLAQSMIFWDLSAIDCARDSNPTNPYFCPFVDGGIKMYTTGGPAQKVATCLGAQCLDAYTEHGVWHGEPSWGIATGHDLFFETCTHGVGLQTNEG